MIQAALGHDLLEDTAIDEDTIRFYDPGLRFPGGETELFLAQATGVDLMKLLVEFALTGSMNEEKLRNDLFRFNGRHSIQLNIACRPGKIGEYVGLEAIRDNPMVCSVFTRYDIGSFVPDSGDVRQRVCEIGLLIDDSVTVCFEMV